MGREMSSLLFLLIAIVYRAAEAKSYCWDFETIDMTNTGMFPWRFSVTGSVPDTTSIPDFSASSNYAWFQDNYGPPNTGTLITTPDTGVTINPGDTVSIDIYRHINYDDGSFRPVVSFVQSGGDPHTQNILWSYNQNVWDTVELTCGPEASPCCLTYPCNGHFVIDASILAFEELLAIDNLQVNQGCSSTPDSCQCDFNNADICSWFLPGWVWSDAYPTSDPPVSPTGTPFLYVRSTTEHSASTNSRTIVGITEQTTFVMDYYLEDSNPSSNTLKIYFQENVGIIFTRNVYFSRDLPTTGGAWIPISYSCSALYDDEPCCTSYPCEGTFHVDAEDVSGTQIVGIDDFVVAHATCETM